MNILHGVVTFKSKSQFIETLRLLVDAFSFNIVTNFGCHLIDEHPLVSDLHFIEVLDDMWIVDFNEEDILGDWFIHLDYTLKEPIEIVNKISEIRVDVDEILNTSDGLSLLNEERLWI